MNEEAVLIAQAIESLRADDNAFRSYLFPLISGFFSAILGGGVAYWTLRIQEGLSHEREKLTIANQWIVEVEGLISSLVAYKQNYYKEISSDPAQRALIVRNLVSNDTPISGNVAELSFITPIREDKSSIDVKWRSIPRIRGLITNYNLILRIVQLRNPKSIAIRGALVTQFGDRGYAEMTGEQILRSVGSKPFLELIDLTEKLVHLVDDIIREANSFLEEFPDVAKSVIDTKKTKSFGRILSFSAEGNDFLLDLLKPCPELDKDKLASIYGLPREDVENLYDNRYRW